MIRHNESEYSGRQPARKPACPFCGMSFERPRELETRRPGEMPVGYCNCGAVYAFDATGHNLGSAFIEALVFGCDMDWDLAWNIFPGEDYLEDLVENYDIESHLIIPGGFYEGRKISGSLYFIRLHREIQEATGQRVRKKLDRAAAPPLAPGPERNAPTRKYTKSEIENLVENYDLNALLEAAGQDKKILRILQRLLVSGDELIRLRSAEMLGKASAVIARREPGAVSTLLQNLFNSMLDTGSSNWGSLEAIGEIIGGSPDIFIGYMPALFQYLNEREHRPKVIRALGLIAGARPDLVTRSIFRLLPFLQDSDPVTRGCTAWLFGRLGAPEALAELEKIRNDSDKINFYWNGVTKSKTVGSLAREALESIVSSN